MERHTHTQVTISVCVSRQILSVMGWDEDGGKGVREKRICRIVTVSEMQFGFIPERGTIDAVFILRRMQEEYHTKEKNVCVLWT